MKKIYCLQIEKTDNGYAVGTEPEYCEHSEEWFDEKMGDECDPVIAFVENMLDDLDGISWDIGVEGEFDWGNFHQETSSIRHILFYDGTPRELYYVDEEDD